MTRARRLAYGDAHDERCQLDDHSTKRQSMSYGADLERRIDAARSTGLRQINELGDACVESQTSTSTTEQMCSPRRLSD